MHIENELEISKTGLPSSPVVKTLCFQRAKIQFLVRKVRSHMLPSAAKTIFKLLKLKLARESLKLVGECNLVDLVRDS